MDQLPLKLKAVIFDMDGVITNTMPDHYLAWKMVLAEEGIHATHLDIYSREGQRGIHSVREIFTKYKKAFSSNQAKRILKRKEELFKKIARRRFIVGARNFIKDLHKKSFQLALVTGTARHEVHRILPEHLYDLFDVVVTGSDVVHGKPHPEPYLKALKMLKVKPVEAVVIENAPFGIRSAKDAGIKCIAIETSLSEQYLLRADYIFSSFKAMTSKINFINH